MEEYRKWGFWQGMFWGILIGFLIGVFSGFGSGVGFIKWQHHVKVNERILDIWQEMYNFIPKDTIP
jgi:ABC-type nitrate/sulfonate/bicarbonate transport system permease component